MLIIHFKVKHTVKSHFKSHLSITWNMVSCQDHSFLKLGDIEIWWYWKPLQNLTIHMGTKLKWSSNLVWDICTPHSCKTHIVYHIPTVRGSEFWGMLLYPPGRWGGCKRIDMVSNNRFNQGSVGAESVPRKYSSLHYTTTSGSMLSCWLQQFDSTIQMLPDQTSVNYSLRSLFLDGRSDAHCGLLLLLHPF